MLAPQQHRSQRGSEARALLLHGQLELLVQGELRLQLLRTTRQRVLACAPHPTRRGSEKSPGQDDQPDQSFSGKETYVIR